MKASEAVEAANLVHDMRVAFVAREMSGNSPGLYDVIHNRIAVAEDTDSPAAVAIALHEFGHAMQSRNSVIRWSAVPLWVADRIDEPLVVASALAYLLKVAPVWWIAQALLVACLLTMMYSKWYLEPDASRRAVRIAEGFGLLDDEGYRKEFFKVLRTGDRSYAKNLISLTAFLAVSSTLYLM